MPVYLIADVTIHDEAGYEEYRVAVDASVEAFGGRFIARGGEIHVKEGVWKPTRLVMLEFVDMATFDAWWDSPEYGRLRAIRERTTTTNLLVTQGL